MASISKTPAVGISLFSGGISSDNGISMSNETPGPSYITPELGNERLWYDMSDNASIIATGNDVTSIQPKTNITHDALDDLNFNTNEFSTDTHTINSLNVIRTVSGGDLRRSGRSNFSSSNTGFMVVETTTSEGILHHQGSVSDYYEISMVGGKARINTTTLGFTNITGTTTITNSVILITWSFDTDLDTLVLRVNGSQEASTGNFTGTIKNSSSTVRISHSSGGANVFSFAELLLYNNILSVSEIDEVELYLMTKWGII